MRRLVVELSPSSAALWSRRLALFALAVIAFGVVLARFGRVEQSAALAVVGAGIAFALASVVLAVIAFGVIWNDGRPGLGWAMAGLLVAALVLGFPGYLAAQAFRLPRLNDVTTDIAEPPMFSRSRKAMQERGGRMPPEIPAAQRAAQQSAYPGVAPVIIDDLPPAEVMPQVLKAATHRGWTVYETVAPGGRTGVGRVEAVDHTLLMRFPDDITIRVKPYGVGSRVDIRSASRIGTHDLGSNARRITAFTEELQAILEAGPAK